MPRPALIIFDGDGVLYDTEPVVTRVQVEVLAALGHRISATDVYRHTGRTGAEFYRAMETQLGATLPDDMNERFVRRYGEVLANGLEPMPGAIALIRRLAVPFCIATNATRLRLDVTLKAAGLAKLFDGCAFSVSDVARGKPAPDLFLYAAKAIGADPAATIAIDDNVTGIVAALAAGMRAIGFVGGTHVTDGQAERLAAAGAETVVQDMDALARRLSHEKILI